MAFPTLADFRAKFPELALVADDANVQIMLDSGAVVLQESSWEPTDWKLAALMWTAHWLVILYDESIIRATGVGISGSGSGAGATNLFVRMIRYEGKMIAYEQRKPVFDTSASTNQFAGPGEASMVDTSYGQIFIKLRHRNFPAIAVI